MLFKKWIKKLEEDHSFVMAIPGQDFANNKENLCALATWTGTLYTMHAVLAGID